MSETVQTIEESIPSGPEATSRASVETGASAPEASEPRVGERAAHPEPGWRDRLETVVERQRAARWASMDSSAVDRVRKIRRIQRWVESHQAEILEAGRADFGKPPTEVELTEIWPVLQEAKHAAAHLADWMEPRRVRPSLALAATRSWVVPEARGMALIISPWNYPLNLTLCPLISALAAGCCVVLKPSEMTPAHSALLRRLVEELFEPDEVALFEGDAEVAQALLEKPFDHVFFTGSSSIGKRVMAAAAEHLASVTLELGGKSPVIVDESAQLGDAVAKIAWGKWANSGQTCIAPDYVLVPRARHDDFVARLVRKVERFYGSSPAQRRQSPDLARIVNHRHFERLRALYDKTVALGARTAIGGDFDAEQRYVAPTVLTEVDPASPAMQQEIFGPILPIVPYDSLDEVVELVRSREKPLALYIFSTDKAVVRRLLADTSAGGSCVNDVALHFLHPRLPFGGVNHSGHGASHGEAGFREFSHHRAVLRHHRLSALKLMAPPYKRLARLLAKLTVRWL
ncbi:MAG: aldehyde dehydrogenase family protein [Acidobacteriota bacterium]